MLPSVLASLTYPIKESLCPGLSGTGKLLEEITLCFTVSFQLGHLFSIYYHRPSNIWGLPEVQRYVSTTVALLTLACALPCVCERQLSVGLARVGMKSINGHGQSTSPVADHFRLPSSHVLQLQSSFRFLRGLPGCAFGYRSKRVSHWASSRPKLLVASQNLRGWL